MRQNLRGRGARSKSFLLFVQAFFPVSLWGFAGTSWVSGEFVAGPLRDDGSVFDTGRDVWSDVVKQWGAVECSVRKVSCCFCRHPFSFPMVVRRSVAGCRERSSPGVLRKEICTRNRSLRAKSFPESEPVVPEPGTVSVGADDRRMRVRMRKKGRAEDVRASCPHVLWKGSDRIGKADVRSRTGVYESCFASGFCGKNSGRSHRFSVRKSIFVNKFL